MPIPEDLFEGTCSLLLGPFCHAVLSPIRWRNLNSIVFPCGRSTETLQPPWLYSSGLRRTRRGRQAAAAARG